ncbi:hypothetical protein QBC42DRAFT_171657 [Cladorrhinum samala]|uniref:Uncharacterized protein n=1 Tax=Cladorrhinum samala TaxID=585594 RepID=A0AAV9HYQ6_9PEZI|nr:hypothetical protein QBC42DRAFT_171657 [Cladorrhinum samala]
MCGPPSNEEVREKLGTAVPPDVTVESVQPVFSLRPQRIYQVDLSDGTSLHLVASPYSKWRPLRSDQGMVLSETVAVRWIKERAQQKFPCLQSPASSVSGRRAAGRGGLNELVPTIFHHGQDASGLREWYTFYAPANESPLALLDPPLSPGERYADSGIDFQVGRFCRQLATLTSPTGRFGPVAATIPISYSIPGSGGASLHHQRQQQLGTGGLFSTVGTATWSVAFHSMLEGALRDGEDMAVVLSYATIRRHFRRLGHLLDEVTTPRLVVVDAGDESNILIRDIGGRGEHSQGEEKMMKKTEKKKKKKQQQRKFAGLRDWSSCVFGDPLLGSVFSNPELQQQPPSSAFLRGFNDDDGGGGGGGSATAAGTPSASVGQSVIEDVQCAWVRLLLYQVFHAVKRIVAEFYRPRGDGGARELEARRNLNRVLAKLAEVPDDVRTRRKKHARPSGEMSPAKRIRALPATPDLTTLRN